MGVLDFLLLTLLLMVLGYDGNGRHARARVLAQTAMALTLASLIYQMVPSLLISLPALFSILILAAFFAIPPEHPCLAGYFPGNPIVQGALFLDEVALLLAQQRSTRRIRRVAQAKFLVVLRSQEICEVDFKDGPEVICKFECRCGERLIASGLLEFESEAGQ